MRNLRASLRPGDRHAAAIGAVLDEKGPAGAGARASGPSLRTLLIGLALLLMVPILVLSGFVLWEVTGRYRADAEARLIDTARALALAVDAEIGGDVLGLTTLATNPLFDPGAAPDPRALDDLLRRAMTARGAPLALMAADGRVLTHTGVPFGDRLPPAAGSDEIAAAVRTARPVVADLRTSAVAGRPVAGVLVPIIRAGQVVGILRARLEPDRLRMLLQRQDMAPGSFAALTDARDVVVARSDEMHHRVLGQPLPPENAAMLRAGEEGIFRATALDGTRRVFGFRHLGVAPGWTVAVAVGEAQFDAEWQGARRYVTLSSAAALTVGSLLAWLAARRILRPLRVMTGHARAVAAGAAPLTAEGGLGALARLPPVREVDELRQGFVAAEAALRRSEEQLRLFVDRAPVAIAMFDTQMNYLAVSQRFVDDLGVPGGDAAALIGRSHYAVFPDTPDEWRRIHQRVLAGERLHSDNERYLRPDGRIDWIRWEMVPWHTPHGAVGGALLYCDVVTSRREAERALATSEARLKLATERSGIGIWEVDCRTGEAWLSRETAALLGVDSDIITVGAWMGLIAVEDRAAVAETWREAQRAGAPYELEYRVVRGDGMPGTWVMARGRVELDEAGMPWRATGVLLDLTERRRAEAALRASEARLSALLDALPVSVALAGADGALLRRNAAHLATWGGADDGRATIRYADLEAYDPASGARLDAEFWPIARALARGETVAGELIEVAAPDARGRRAMLGNAAPIRDEWGRIVGAVVAELDVTEQRRAETALAAREAELRDLLATVDLGTFMARDLDGTIRHWSGGCERLYGWTAAEAVGQVSHALLQTVHPIPLAELDAELVRTGEWVGDLRHTTRDGRELLVRARKVLRRERGGLLAVLEAITDVTGQRQAEAALAEYTARLQTIVETVPVGLVMAELPSGRIVGGNSYVETMLRHPIRHSPDLDSYDEWVSYHADGSRVQGHEYPLARMVLTGEETPSIDVLYERGDGSRSWTRIMGRPVRNAAGELVGGVVALVDIDGERRAREALADSEARLRLALDAGGMGFWTWDLWSDTLQWDARQFALFDMDPAGGGPTGAEALARVHPEDLPGLEAAIRHALSRGDGAFSSEFRVVRRDGGVRWIGAHGRATPGADGVAARMSGLNFDITARRQAEAVLAREAAELEQLADERGRALAASEARLAEAARMEALGRLAGGIAHDFNNVLQAVQGGLLLVERRLRRDPDAAQQILTRTLQATERGAAITGRLLAFARRGELRSEVVAPGPLLTGIADLLTHTLGADIAVRVDVPPHVPSLVADRAQLEAVLVNLANNARDAMPDGGRLLLKAASAHAVQIGAPRNLAAGRYVRVSVADTGEGMPPDILARVTEPFFTTKPQGKGTGLGLAMARGFAEQSGGGLAIESVVGRGTTVSLWLPEAAPGGEEPGTAAALPVRAGGAVAAAPSRGTVLLVEDHQDVREVLALELEDRGYAAAEAGSGPEALALVGEGLRPLAVVTDLKMPGAPDGLALIGEIRSVLPGLPAVLVTGHPGDATGAQLAAAEEGGPFALLRKPVDADTLARHLRLLLRPRA